MIALCDNRAQRASAVVVQTLFIPKSLSKRHVVDLPLSRELSIAFKRLGIKSLGDLNGVPIKSFQWVSNDGHTVAAELVTLIEQLRSDQTATTSAPKRTRATPHPVASELNHPDTIVIPQDARGRALTSFSLSVRLTRVLHLQMFRLLGELHGLTYLEVSKFRNCGRKTVEELRQFVRNVQLGTVVGEPADDESPYASASRSDCLFIPP